MVEPLDLDGEDLADWRLTDPDGAWNALIAELRATRAELRDAVAAVDSEFARAERAEAELAHHDECTWSRKAWDTLAELADAKSAIARVRDVILKWHDCDAYYSACWAEALAALDGDV